RVQRTATGDVAYLNINTTRITDLSVRQAMSYAIDRTTYLTAMTDRIEADPALTIMPPSFPGYRVFDQYPGGAHGDPAKAQALLAGRTVTRRVCVRNVDYAQQGGQALVSALNAAGFTATLTTIPPADFQAVVSKASTDCDATMFGYSVRYPDGFEVF